MIHAATGSQWKKRQVHLIWSKPLRKRTSYLAICRNCVVHSTIADLVLSAAQTQWRVLQLQIYYLCMGHAS